MLNKHSANPPGSLEKRRTKAKTPWKGIIKNNRIFNRASCAYRQKSCRKDAKYKISNIRSSKISVSNDRKKFPIERNSRLQPHFTCNTIFFLFNLNYSKKMPMSFSSPSYKVGVGWVASPITGGINEICKKVHTCWPHSFPHIQSSMARG